MSSSTREAFYEDEAQEIRSTARLGSTAVDQRPATRLEQLLSHMEENRNHTLDSVAAVRRATDQLIGVEPEADKAAPASGGADAFIYRFEEAVAAQERACNELARQVRRLEEAGFVN